MIICDVNTCSDLDLLIWIILWNKLTIMEEQCDFCDLSEDELELLQYWIIFYYGNIAFGDIYHLMGEQSELGKSRAVLIWVTPQLKYL